MTDTPTATIAAPSSAPATVPMLKPAWKRGMIERPRRCSTSAPSTFIATSQVPLPDAEQEQPDDDRRDADLVADRRDRKPAGRDERRDHDRARSAEPRHDHPGERQRDDRPAAIASSRRPRLAGLRSRPSRTCGMRDAQLANAKPEPMKTA